MSLFLPPFVFFGDPFLMKKTLLITLSLLLLLVTGEAEAKKRRKRRYTGPPPTHPVVLWSRTLMEGTDAEERRKAAFKMSKYSQLIFQQEAVASLTKCIKDPDTKIKIWCTKAMGRAGTQANAESIRNALLDQYKNDPILKDTIVRAFIARKDDSKPVQETLLDSLKSTESPESQITLLSYFEKYGAGSKIIDTVIAVYNKSSDTKVKTAAVTTLATRAEGQDAVIAFLSQCASQHENIETPLVLNCLSGLQQQARLDARTWQAVEKTIDSEDADVVYATLDLINALPVQQNEKVSGRLLKIIQDVDDDDTLERAILALGVCGTSSESITETLRAQLESTESSEGTRIASALVLGKQSHQFPEKPRETLSKCAKEAKSGGLRTACQLGLKDVESVKKAASPPKSSVESNRSAASEKIEEDEEK